MMGWALRWFRLARPARSWWNVGKTLAQLVVFWSAFLWVIPRALSALERRLHLESFAFPPALGWAGFAIASALGASSGMIMAWEGRGTPLPLDAPRRLVVRGPYRFVRNPMAIAGLAQGAFVGCLLGSWLTLGYVAAGMVLWNYLVRPVEERHLEQEFGVEYRRYQSMVRCWVPRWPRYRPEW